MLTCGFDLGSVGGTFTSTQFSETVSHITGDGVAPLKNRLNLTMGDGFHLTVGTGYALVAGRWIHLNQPLALGITPPGYSGNRYDAVAVQVDYNTRKVEIVALQAVDPKSPVRNESVYQMYLYLIYVRRGVGSLSAADVTDVRNIFPMQSDTTSDGEIIYSYVTMGMDADIARLEKRIADGKAALLAESDAIMKAADEKIAKLQNDVADRRGAVLGDLVTGMVRPIPNHEWLLCNGGEIPKEAYPDLLELVGENLPEIVPDDERFKTWIYAGEPATEADYYFEVNNTGNLRMFSLGNKVPAFSLSGENLVYGGDEEKSLFISQRDGHLYEVSSQQSDEMTILDLGRVVGPQGEPGMSVYEAAVLGGYAGTEPELIELLGNAADGATRAEIAAEAAQTSANVAETAKDTAEAARDTAVELKTATQNYADAAKSSAEKAKSSEAGAAKSERNAADSEETMAKTKEEIDAAVTAAAQSEQKAKSSATSAANDADRIKFMYEEITNGDLTPVIFTVTLPADGWDTGTLRVSDTRFLAGNYAYIPAPADDSATQYNESLISADDVTGAGVMTFHCVPDNVPDRDLTVNVIRMMVLSDGENV